MYRLTGRREFAETLARWRSYDHFGPRVRAVIEKGRGALLDAGIVATIQADPAGSLLGLGRVRVLVREEDAATAREVLNLKPPGKPTYR